MRLSDLPPDARRRVLEQADTKTRPRDRRVAKGPYRATCYTCKETFTAWAAVERHRDAHGHFRYEAIV